MLRKESCSLDEAMNLYTNNKKNKKAHGLLKGKDSPFT
jgi:hypothetical protein